MDICYTRLALLQDIVDPNFTAVTLLCCCEIRPADQHRQLARLLWGALQPCKSGAVNQVIESCAPDTPSSRILQLLKPLMGSTNPNKRKIKPLPQLLDEHGTPDDQRDRWVQFFGRVEGGARMEWQELRSQWRGSLHAMDPPADSVALSEFLSL